MNDPTKTTYGEKNESSPQELEAFSFLIGKWDGKGKTRLENGKIAEYPVTWIGRYILDGSAIADEFHSLKPDGSPYLGISFRQYDRTRNVWLVEYLNVSDSFLRKQVSDGSGSVTVHGRNVTVASASPGVEVHEHYEVADRDNWIYRLDVSNDDGKSWNEGLVEVTFHRSQ